MGALSPILRSVEGGRLMFWCTGCDGAHMVGVSGPGPHWGYNGDPDKPTFSPSIKAEYNGPDAGELDDDGNRVPPAICHSFVRDGRSAFLSDCTHELAGQMVDLSAWSEL